MEYFVYLCQCCPYWPVSFCFSSESQWFHPQWHRVLLGRTLLRLLSPHSLPPLRTKDLHRQSDIIQKSKNLCVYKKKSILSEYFLSDSLLYSNVDMSLKSSMLEALTLYFLGRFGSVAFMYCDNVVSVKPKFICNRLIIRFLSYHLW